MSYFKKIEYEIVVEESFPVIRNCAGCGRKTNFKNTNKFRVNANGNKLDVWLIYQCENCKHTWNLSVYERQRPTAIRAEKQIADVTGLSRSQVKRLNVQGKIKIVMDSPLMLAVILQDESLLAK